ncbi:PREDICTED: WAT1-related protein At2g39510-like [Ipomoea nil]|uniref:WAT1-related protein At2g39510-like n=1 Tax=Ipomoea nil TaxID=35883 RepID=UPI0009015400|nr:PREDICTED: WAT1-related protein At2g39510-like [Ipomoea nil]
MGNESFVRWLKHAKPYFGVLFLQLSYAASSLISKSALNQGMNHYIFVVYRNIIAAVFFAPFAMLFERKIRPRMTITIFLKIMLLALLEPVIDQNLYYAGMKYTTATFATAMCNVLPAITFLLAWILRLEKVNIRSLHSQGKIVGTTLTIGGAMIMTLVRGHIIGLPWTSKHVPQTQSIGPATEHDHVKGAVMIAAGCFCWSCFYILQAITLKSYPAGLSLTCLICMAGALQSTVLTLVVERGNYGIWALHWDTTFLAYVYNGIIRSGVVYYISGVIMNEKGPFFVTAFNPLSMIMVAIVGSFMLAEQLDFGKIFGAVVIIVGLYLVIWGKSKDISSSKSSEDDDNNALSNNKESILTKQSAEQKIDDTIKIRTVDDTV